jgi:hypothetical protein
MIAAIFRSPQTCFFLLNRTCDNSSDTPANPRCRGQRHAATREGEMKDFKQLLYEAFTTAFGKVLAKYNAFSQGAVLRDVGREMTGYMVKNGFEFEEQRDLEDVERLINSFVEHGFAQSLEVQPEGKSTRYIRPELYGSDAYQDLHEVTDNAFLACPPEPVSVLPLRQTRQDHAAA